MSAAGLNTKVLKSGTPTAMTDERLSTFNSTVEYIINSTDKRVWDYSSSLTFEENSCSTSPTTISSTNIASINRLFGIVTFNSQPSSEVQVSGKYLPMAKVAGANTKSLSLSKALLDDTEFDSSGYISRTDGLKDVSLSITRWDDVSTDFYDLINTGNSVIVEVRPGGSTNFSAKGIFKVSAENRSGDVSALESADISLELASTSTAPAFDIQEV